MKHISKLALLVACLFGTHLHANISSKEVIAESDWMVRAGRGDKAKAEGYSNKTPLTRSVQKSPTPKAKTPESEVSPLLDKAIIMHMVNKHGAEKKVERGSESNVLATPKALASAMDTYAQARAESTTSSSGQAGAQPPLQIEFLQCYTASDYKISLQNRMELICSTNSTMRKIYANVNVARDGNFEMNAVPYVMETVKGKYIPLESESRMFHAVSGSANLATYVDTKALERVKKDMANTFSASSSEAAKDYIEKKNAPSSSVSQTETSTVTATTSPEPDIGDYGISVLVDVLAKGISSGVDQLYQDLGYIYFVPKNTPVNIEAYYRQGANND